MIQAGCGPQARDFMGGKTGAGIGFVLCERFYPIYAKMGTVDMHVITRVERGGLKSSEARCAQGDTVIIITVYCTAHLQYDNKQSIDQS